MRFIKKELGLRFSCIFVSTLEIININENNHKYKS